MKSILSTAILSMCLASGIAQAKNYSCSTERPYCPVGRTCDVESGFCAVNPLGLFSRVNYTDATPFHCNGDNIHVFGEIRGSFTEDLKNPGNGTIAFHGRLSGLNSFSRNGNFRKNPYGDIVYDDFEQENISENAIRIYLSDQITQPNRQTRLDSVYLGRKFAQLYMLNCRFEPSTQPEEPFCSGMNEPCKDNSGRWNCCPAGH